MQFLISLHINPAVLDALTGEEKAAIGDGHGKFIEALKKSGELISTQALVDPSQAAVVSVRNGVQGVSGRLLPDRLREQGAGDRAGSADPGRRDRGSGGRGAAGDVR
jgi:hypothetical protein